MFEMLVFLILNNPFLLKTVLFFLKVKYKVSGEVYVSCDHKYKISYSL